MMKSMSQMAAQSVLAAAQSSALTTAVNALTTATAATTATVAPRDCSKNTAYDLFAAGLATPVAPWSAISVQTPGVTLVEADFDKLRTAVSIAGTVPTGDMCDHCGAVANGVGAADATHKIIWASAYALCTEGATGFMANSATELCHANFKVVTGPAPAWKTQRGIAASALVCVTNQMYRQIAGNHATVSATSWTTEYAPAHTFKLTSPTTLDSGIMTQYVQPIPLGWSKGLCGRESRIIHDDSASGSAKILYDGRCCSYSHADLGTKQLMPVKCPAGITGVAANDVQCQLFTLKAGVIPACLVPVS